MHELVEPDLSLPLTACTPSTLCMPVLHSQGVAVSNWKKVVHLLHHYLTRTLSENADLLAHKDRLEADLFRTELELEKAAALVSALLAGHATVVYADEAVDGNTTAAANVNDRQSHPASSERQARLCDASSAGGSVKHQGSLDVNTSSAGGLAKYLGAKPAARAPDDGGDFDACQGSLDGSPVKTHNLGNTHRIGDTLASGSAMLSTVTEGSEENLGSGDSEKSWSPFLGDEDVTSLSISEVLVTEHEASQALHERGDRFERTGSGRLTRSCAAAPALDIDRVAPKSPAMVGPAGSDADRPGDDDGLSLLCSCSASSSSSGSSRGCPRAATSPAAPEEETSYRLPRVAKSPRSGLQRSADTRSSSTLGHHSRHPTVVPDARSTKPDDDEGEPAAADGTRAKTRRRSVHPTFTTGNRASSTGARGSNLLVGCPLATGWISGALGAANSCAAKERYPRRDYTARNGREKPIAGPQPTDTLKELHRINKRAINKKMPDRLSAVTTEHVAAMAALAHQPSGFTAARKALSTEIWSAPPLLGRQGAAQPLSSLQTNAGYRMTEFVGRDSVSCSGSTGVDLQGAAASTMVSMERGVDIRMSTPGGIGCVSSTTYDCRLDTDVKQRFGGRYDTVMLHGPPKCPPRVIGAQREVRPRNDSLTNPSSRC